MKITTEDTNLGAAAYKPPPLHQIHSCVPFLIVLVLTSAPRDPHNSSHKNASQTRKAYLKSVFELQDGIHLILKGYFDTPSLPWKRKNKISKGMEGVFKNEVTSDLRKYIAQDSRAAAMLRKLSEGGKKTFLLTNSDWIYTDLVMSHVMGSQWRQLFDVVIVDGEKPKWFLGDSAFKTVDLSTGCAQMGSHSGPLQKNDVYCKGCATEFVKRMGLTGKDILYVGDHIFGDVLKSKKVDGWRTLLIVPELGTELKVWSQQQPKFHKLVELHQNLSLDLAEEDRKNVLKQISKISNDMEAEYGSMGSMLRCGWRQTHFAGQLGKYADLYTGNVYNLYGYSCAHYFNSPIQLLPHEEKIIRGMTPVMMGLPHEERVSGLLSELSDSEREEEYETESNDSACCGCCRIRKK